MATEIAYMFNKDFKVRKSLAKISKEVLKVKKRTLPNTKGELFFK
jgi:hypothetical protein